MKTKTKAKSKAAPPTFPFQVNEHVSLEEQIAARAHELWQQRDHEHGSDVADWLRAEREIDEWHRARLEGGTPSVTRPPAA